MKLKLIGIFLLLLFCACTKAFATIDYLVVNHVTNQLYLAETDHPPGWIGWEPIPEGKWEAEEKRYKELGYRYTKNPFLIEEVIAAVIALSLFWVVRTRKGSKKVVNT